MVKGIWDMKDIGILHLSHKYLLGGQVTLGERGLGQILNLNDHGSYNIISKHEKVPQF